MIHALILTGISFRFRYCHHLSFNALKHATLVGFGNWDERIVFYFCYFLCVPVFT